MFNRRKARRGTQIGTWGPEDEARERQKLLGQIADAMCELSLTEMKRRFLVAIGTVPENRKWSYQQFYDGAMARLLSVSDEYMQAVAGETTYDGHTILLTEVLLLMRDANRWLTQAVEEAERDADRRLRGEPPVIHRYWSYKNIPPEWDDRGESRREHHSRGSRDHRSHRGHGRGRSSASELDREYA